MVDLGRFLVAVLALALLLPVAGCGGGVGSGPSIGSILPPVEFTVIDGTAWTAGDRPVLVNFWATWCLQCKTAVPDLRQLATHDGIDVVGIALDSNRSTVTRFAERHGLDYPLALTDDVPSERFGVPVRIPHSVLVGADRKVLAVYRGKVSRDEVVRDLERAGGTS